MSVTLIVTSFLSFPLSFVVARFTIVPPCDFSHYESLLKDVARVVACFSIVCDVIVIASILWKRKINKLPYCYVLCLVATQILTCGGVLLWQQTTEDRPGGAAVLTVLTVYGGEISSTVWLCAMALAGSATKRHPTLEHSGFSIICTVTFLVCTVVTTMMVALVICNGIERVYVAGHAQSNFELLQLSFMTVLQATCLFVVGFSLLQHFKPIKEQKGSHPEKLENQPPKNSYDFDNPLFFMDSNNGNSTHCYKRRVRSASVLSVQSEKDESELYSREVLHTGGSEGAMTIRRGWSFRFYSLLLLIAICTCVRFVSNLYKLAQITALEIIIPLEFLQLTLFVGQGFFILLTFGIDVRTLSIQTTKWWRKIRFGKEEFVTTLSDGDLNRNAAAAQFCNQFETFYMSKCFRSLAKDRKWKDNFFSNCFWGHQMVDWLIQEGVAKDDLEAEEMGQLLLFGGVISHIRGAHHFHDAPYLYYFSKRERRVIHEEASSSRNN